MPIISSFMKRVKRVHCGLDTRREFLLGYIDRIIFSLTGKRTSFYYNARLHRMSKIDGEMYQIRDIKLPLLDKEEENTLFGPIYQDTFWSYVYCNDQYDEETFDQCDRFMGEGLYGLVNDRVNVTVEPGDVVIDVGSWIGDFAAYASVRGATTYAFEPSKNLFRILERTAELNGGIIPVQKALGDISSSKKKIGGVFNASSEDTFDVTTIDDFVRENNIPRVDFIKADIEGFERHMLAGAQETLARFSPKLALCTYHLPDDPQVMASLIKQANPKYNIVQKRKKLFASVPK